ncbi:histidine phosphatase family protein [Nocardiopsis halotolerans]|uniref:histidine phosphatase family protein n=1 Tax=Nocardiopsis halotolerans TaxID=124252 RepID=UPI00034544CD|nr:histidine phosphatase family protein [Nocardiopsis halotolerans]
MPATRHLYLARHAEADREHASLNARGRRQALRLGQLLRQQGVETLHHGPAPRTAQTAHLAAREVGVAPVVAPEAGDYAPHLPTRAELPPQYADTVMDFVDSLPAHERAQGPELGLRALERFTGPARGDRERREAVITHAHPAAWLLCAALEAPAWRWVTLAPANAALTVVRYTPGRPASVLAFNDTSHLADEHPRPAVPQHHPCTTTR